MLITIGAFDGFHRGHAELFRLCRKLAGNDSPDNWAVVSFWPHPSEYIHKLSHTLFTLKERELLRRVLDIPNMYILDFDDALRNLTPSEFWRLVRERFGADGLVIGRDFHFGLNRAGNSESLVRLAEHDGINANRIYVADLLDKPKFSSSNVRKFLQAGDVKAASEILGYPCFITGRITSGSQRGRTMHFPTANIDIHGRIIPAYGVYSSAVLVNGEIHCGAVSIGNNPTFHDIHDARFEVYILDFEGDIYGEELAVFFLGRVRDMHTFPDKNALVHQIAADTQTCRKIYEEAVNVPETQLFLKRAGDIFTSHNLNPEIIRLV